MPRRARRLLYTINDSLFALDSSSRQPFFYRLLTFIMSQTYEDYERVSFFFWRENLKNLPPLMPHSRDDSLETPRTMLLFYPGFAAF